ncbi:hypothetical protein ZIOFF_043702 [Zingiber officinale]|uniref:Uncharacterized protein n=1 Tax=Zingiber officinale TaxID=94328 RepID=A0A8J5GB14_ZINOF|nr:hypothetical protein ZIOFF_043702 [Zingiber officinale]
MVIVDLGCSSGPNTFIVVSQVLNIIIELRRMMEMNKPLDVQFLLNDLLGNDFNYVFQSLHKFKKKVEEETKGELLVPYYVVGVPRSFYGRLFPRASVHFFYSSYSLMWLSQVLNLSNLSNSIVSCKKACQLVNLSNLSNSIVSCKKACQLVS